MKKKKHNLDKIENTIVTSIMDHLFDIDLLTDANYNYLHKYIVSLEKDSKKYFNVIQNFFNGNKE